MDATLPSDAGTARVVLADDQSLIRELLAFYLSWDPRYNLVAQAGELAQALGLCAEHQPAVLILALSLLALDGGAEALAVLRGTAPGTGVLLFCPAHAEEAALRAALHAGVGGCVETSATPKEFRAAMGAVAHGAGYFSPRSAQLRQRMQDPPDQPREDPEPSAIITPREREVLRLLALGRTNKEVASRLGLSTGTVRIHREHLHRQLGLHNGRPDPLRRAPRPHPGRVRR